MVQVEKIRKIGKKHENFRKSHVFEANIIALAENFRNLRTWPGKAFPCGSVFEILNCRGELCLKKNSRNFYKSRGMSRFGEKKQAQLPMRDGSEQTTSSREPRSNGFYESAIKRPNCMGYIKILFRKKKTDYCRKKSINFPIFVRHFLNDQ